MKKNFIYLLLLCSLIAQAQITPSYPTIKLTKTIEGVKQDSLLVVGTDKTVKHIPSSKITSILEYTTASALPITGVAGKIYVTKDNGKIYRWNGTYYAELAITDISGKVDKIVGKGLSTEDYTTPEKTKLAELFNYDPTTINNAIALKVDKVTGKSLLSDTEITRLTTLSNYTHPTNHPPSVITQDASNRFVTDVEKTAWNAKQGALGFTPENVANKNTANGYAGLGSDGKLISSQLPSITISDTFVTASQAAMLALTAETGDVAVRTDLNKSFILKENNPTVLASWQELLTPTSEVTSVNGRTGAVVVTKADVSLNNADNTSDINKPISTATQTVLDLKANLASPALTGTPTAPTATAGTNTTQIATTAFVTGANAGNVKLTGSQSITGIKSFSNPNFAPIQVTTNNGNGILVNATTGIGLQSTSSGNFAAANFTGQAGANTLTITNQSGSTGAGLSVSNTGAGVNIASSGGSGNTFTVDKFGATTATSFIKSSAPATNILLAGGGDIAQNTAFNKNFGTTAGTVVEGNYPPAKDGTGATGSWGINISGSANNSILWSGIAADFSTYGSDLFQGIGYDSTEDKVKPYTTSKWSSWLGLGSNAYTSTAYLPLSGGTLSGAITATSYTATSLPVFENNAAASSLAVGQFYRTSIGVLMVKF